MKKKKEEAKKSAPKQRRERSIPDSAHDGRGTMGHRTFGFRTYGEMLRAKYDPD